MVVIFTAGCTAFENLQAGEAPGDTLSRAKDYQTEEYAMSPLSNSVQATPAPAHYGGSDGAGLAFPEQKIIKTADVSIEVSNVTLSAEKIQNIVETLDGLIQSSSIYESSQGQYSGTVTIRVPADRFNVALAKIQVIGKVLSSSVNADDVTEEYVDLQAQRDALTNQLAQYNRILEKGQNVSEILEVQKEIERVQVELDRIVGRMKYLETRTSFSTITTRLSEPAHVETPSGYSLPSVISDGIEGFVNTVIWLFVVILTLLPLILLGAAGYLIYKKWKKNQT